MLTVTIPLVEYVELCIRTGQYTVIDDAQKKLIEASGDISGICHIENSTHALDFYCRPLPELRQGLWRLWYRKDWEINDNKRRATNAKFELLDKERNAKKELIIQNFVKLGIAESIAREMLQGMSDDVINLTLQSQGISG